MTLTWTLMQEVKRLVLASSTHLFISFRIHTTQLFSVHQQNQQCQSTVGRTQSQGRKPPKIHRTHSSPYNQSAPSFSRRPMQTPPSPRSRPHPPRLFGQNPPRQFTLLTLYRIRGRSHRQQSKTTAHGRLFNLGLQILRFGGLVSNFLEMARD
jgi:hypothetical protein